MLAVAALAVTAVVAAGAGTAGGTAVGHICIPASGGPFVSKVTRISIHAACRVAEKLFTWTEHGHRLVRCPPSGIGVGTLLVHKFDGYRLRIRSGLLVMSRGPSSFRVSGYSDAPVGCD
jgi:hypothetical protein